MIKRLAIAPRRALIAVPAVVLALGGGLLPASSVLASPSPSITSISPTVGSECGGTSVTISGSGFSGASEVDFGSAVVPSSSFTLATSTTIQLPTPPHDTGTVAVVVKNGGNSSNAVNYTFAAAAPSVTALNPASGTTNGGTTVTITGGCFVDNSNITSVTFGSTPATDFNVVNTTSMTATSPAHSAGVVNLTVSTPGGSSSQPYTYVASATVSSISPIAGPTAGGTTVTIKGTGFIASPPNLPSCLITKVTFGGTAGTIVTSPTPSCHVDTQNPMLDDIQAISPAKSVGTVDVQVWTCNDCASATNGSDLFSYMAAPTVTGVNPQAGSPSGGDSVTISGTDFATPGGQCVVTEVDFGAGNKVTLPNPVVCTVNSITVTSPSGNGLVDVLVTTLAGTSTANPSDQFLYTGIFVASVTPDGGPPGGGNATVIRGFGFSGASAVTFGPNAAGGFTVVSDAEIDVPSVPGGVGTVDVQVTANNVQSPAVASDKYTYTLPPVVLSVSPSSGPSDAPNSVTITGSGFDGGTTSPMACDIQSISFGNNTVTDPTQWGSTCTDTSVTVNAPPIPEPAGNTQAVNVSVTTDGGPASQTATYTYVASPTVSSVAPASGSTLGGNTVTINGTHFFSNAGACDVKAVHFGNAAADATTIGSCTDTSFTVTVPAAGAQNGLVDTTVTTNAGGTSPTGPADGYTYLIFYYFTWYDHLSSPGFLNDNIHVVNPSASLTATVSAHIPGQPACDLDNVSIGPGAFHVFSCGTGFGGPVLVTSDQPVIVGQRVQFYQTFNEVPARAASAAAKQLQFGFYDRISSPGFHNDNIHVVNPGPNPATVNVSIPGQPACDTTGAVIAAGAEQIFSCSTGFGGPVTVTSDNPVLASQRTQFYQSFNEEWGQAPSDGGTTVQFGFYDHASSPGFLNDNLHVWNPSSTVTATVSLTIPGVSTPCVFTNKAIAPGGELVFSCADGFGGPVTITSDNPVLASQRVEFYQSFNEVPGVATSKAATKMYFIWYDHVSSPGFLNDNIQVWNPGASTATVTVSIPSCSDQTKAVDPGAEQIFACASGFGGPVVVSSDKPILSSERVQFYQSFNEVLGAT